MSFKDNMLRPVPVDFEPKRINRWYIEFPADVTVAEWAVQAASRPKLKINETEIRFMNTSSFVLGHGVWESIQVTFIDCIGPSTGQALMDWVRQSFEASTGRMGYAASYKKTLILKMLDPAGQTVEKWSLYGCMITDIDWGQLSMDQDSIAGITCQIRYDRAILNF